MAATGATNSLFDPRLGNCHGERRRRIASRQPAAAEAAAAAALSAFDAATALLVELHKFCRHVVHRLITDAEVID